MAASDETASIRILGGRYQLVRRLGQRGRSSTVYEAFDRQLERTVAVKLIDPNAVATPDLEARFWEVARELMTLNHPNIVAIHDYGAEDIDGTSTPYLVMELLTGGSLRAILDRGRTLSPSQALLIGLDLCRGLDHAHRRGIIHGDVKPSNMLFGEDRRLRVADFGLSRLVGKALGHRAADLDLTSARYASPEQAADKRLDGRSDVYSVALVLTESVTGQVPFASDTTVATLANRVDRLLPVSADMGALAAVLERAGRPNPTDRTSAAEFGRALLQSASQMPRPTPVALVSEGSSLFDAPPGQETTTEMTRFADPTGQLRRDSTGSIRIDPARIDPTGGIERDTSAATLRDVTGSIPRDPAGSVGRDVTGPMRRDQTGSVGRDVTGSVRRDQTGATQRPRVVTVDEQGVERDEAPPVERKPILTWMALALGVIVVGVLALIAYRKLNEPEHEVPVLIGLEQGQAENQISSFNWNVEIQQRRDDSQPQGRVLATDPTAGVKLKEGVPFLIVVSSGPTLSPLPELAGKSLAEATEMLTSVGLAVGQASEVFDEQVLPGVVIKWQIAAQPQLAAGAEVTKGTTVDVVISKGPAPRSVDDMTGQTLEAVQSWYQAQGVTVVAAPEPVFSNDIPAGAVVSQNIAAGATVERGSSIEVVLSKGPDVVPAPVLVGLGFDAAKAAIEGAGFVFGTYTGNYFTGAVNAAFVSGAQIADGQPVLRGSTIDIAFAS